MCATRCGAPRTCCTGSGSPRRSRSTARPSATRTRSPPGGLPPGRRYEASGGDRSVDLLRGRGRADVAPAEGPHLEPPRPHPRDRRVRCSLPTRPGADRTGRPRGLSGAIPNLSPWNGIGVALVQLRISVACALRSRERRFESYWGRLVTSSENSALYSGNVT